MSEKKYQLSPNIRIIFDPKSETAMVYHTLYGNPRIVNEESLRFLDLFKKPVAIEEIVEICDENPKDIIREFTEIFFLVEHGFDEKKLLQEKKEQLLILVQKQSIVDRIGLAISDSCNFGCTHCIHFQLTINSDKTLPIYQLMTSQLNMTWETARQCVDQYVELMIKQEKSHGKIHFGNAEPLINWPVIEQVLEYCSGMDNFSFEFALNTNLELMTREIAKVCKKYQVRIATSLDGTQIANDAIRVTKNGQGTFTHILEKFDLLAEIDYPLDGFSITVTKDNFELINTDVIDLAVDKKMTSLAFDYDLISLTHISVKQRVSKLMQFKKYANEHNIDFFGTWDSPFRNLTSGNFLSDNQAFCAAVQDKSLEFDVDGSIKICSHTTATVGHIDRFHEVFKKKGSLTQIITSRFPGMDMYCFGCDIEGLCSGQCHVTREVVSHSTTKDQQKLFTDMCDFYRKITEVLIIENLQLTKTI